MSKFFNFKSLAKYWMVLFACLLFNQVKTQAQVYHADPALVGFDITDLSDVAVDANLLNLNSVYKLKLQLTNFGPDEIPVNTTELIIGLGLYLEVDPAFDLSTAPLSNYFTWTKTIDPSGQVTITGNLHTPLPKLIGFAYEAVFNIKPLSLTPSGNAPAITGNWTVNNLNPPPFLSDENGTNNSASLDYRVVPGSPLPVTLISFNAFNKNCNISADWKVENEMNFDRYELQISKDGINFHTISTIKAQNKSAYTTTVSINDLDPQLRVNNVVVRLKMVDIDGSFKFSKVVSLPGKCNGNSQQEFYVFPNPVTAQDYITIASKGKEFEGKYQLVLIDISGKVYAVKQVNLNSVSTLRFEVNNRLAAGKYFIKIRKVDGSEIGVVQFEKL